MIKLDNVTKFYKYKNKIHYVLNKVHFEFPTKTNIAILGHNGAGKSTLLRLIGGMESPNSGKIHTVGRISWPVGQTQGTQGSLTARDNIRFVTQIFGKSIEESKQIISFVENFAEIGKHFDMPVKTYSSGMKARINFGLSMAFDFDYYLVDECTSVGDKSFRDKAKAMFDEKRKSSSIIMVSHNMTDLRANCDVALYVNDGKVKLYEDVEEAIKLYQNYKRVG